MRLGSPAPITLLIRIKKLFSYEKAETTIIDHLETETVVQIWSENRDMKGRISSDLTVYFHKPEVPEGRLKRLRHKEPKRTGSNSRFYTMQLMII